MADALAALTKLKGPLSRFPFLTDADEAVALSALLTSVCRMALSSAPLHGYSAPTAGSGKSILADTASVLRTGREASTIAPGKTAEEFEKRLSSMLLEGDGCVAIDNCETPLGGEFLCQALTQPSLKVRPLGKSVMIEVSTAALFTATGNNLTFIGDMGRRALLCQLDPGVERPELRKFAFDPVQVIKNNRSEFVAAALTILRAYHVAGRPFQVAPLGSFADWSNLVRSALIWLGCADPCDTMDKVRKADPELAQMKLMMAQWDVVVGAKSVTTGQLTALATEMVEVSIGSALKKLKHPEFRDALLATAGDGQNINGRRLGNWLSKRKERVVDGKKFITTGDRGGQLVWRLEHVAAVSGATAQ
jgi:putative DNA primase/helicase